MTVADLVSYQARCPTCDGSKTVALPRGVTANLRHMCGFSPAWEITSLTVASEAYPSSAPNGENAGSTSEPAEAALPASCGRPWSEHPSANGEPYCERSTCPAVNPGTCSDHPFHVCRCLDEDRRVRAAIAALIREHEQGASDV